LPRKPESRREIRPFSWQALPASEPHFLGRDCWQTTVGGQGTVLFWASMNRVNDFCREGRIDPPKKIRKPVPTLALSRSYWIESYPPLSHI
jgi:hypothetical protein